MPCPRIRNTIPLLALLKTLGASSDKAIINMIVPDEDPELLQLLTPTVADAAAHRHVLFFLVFTSVIIKTMPWHFNTGGRPRSYPPNDTTEGDCFQNQVLAKPGNGSP